MYRSREEKRLLSWKMWETSIHSFTHSFIIYSFISANTLVVVILSRKEYSITRPSALEQTDVGSSCVSFIPGRSHLIIGLLKSCSKNRSFVRTSYWAPKAFGWAIASIKQYSTKLLIDQDRRRRPERRMRFLAELYFRVLHDASCALLSRSS